MSLLNRVVSSAVCSMAAVLLPWGASAEDSLPGNGANPEAIEQVRAGTLTTANASWWGFDEDDATQALQAAIDSGAGTVVVPYMGAPWIVTPITLRGNLTLRFEPGVVVLAKEGEFKGKGDSLFTAADATGIAIQGYGAALRMRKQDYQTEAYEPAEWRMTLAFRGCRDIRVEGVRLESSGGDGIYLGATSALPWCEDVVIRDVVCHDHHRQGISIIGAVNLLIENCIFSATDGTAPRAGIDFEPNHEKEQLANCVVRNCRMLDNAGAGILVYLKPLSKQTRPVSILFEDCLVRGGRSGGIVVGAARDDGPEGLIEFRNCTVENPAEAGAYVYDKSAASVRVRFVNCHFKNLWTGGSEKDKRPRSPLLLNLARPELTQGHGGIDFVQCHVYDDNDRPAFTVVEQKSGNGVSDIKGGIIVHSPHPARAELGEKTADCALTVVNAAMHERD